MGRLYTKYTLQSEQTLANFENGTVRSPSGALGFGNETLMYYDEGRIFRSTTSSFGDGYKNVLARCSQFGRIEDASGTLLGYCEDGVVKDSSGSSIAYYEGDTYGAAAAACAVLFGLSDAAQSQRSDHASSDKAQDSSGSAASTGDSSALSMVFTILGAIIFLAWKVIKTIPFWAPYVCAVLVLFFVNAPGAGGPVIALFLLAYAVLHTILLIKCRKKEGKFKYGPVYVSFFSVFSVLLILVLLR